MSSADSLTKIVNESIDKAFTSVKKDIKKDTKKNILPKVHPDEYMISAQYRAIESFLSEFGENNSQGVVVERCIEDAYLSVKKSMKKDMEENVVLKESFDNYIIRAQYWAILNLVKAIRLNKY